MAIITFEDMINFKLDKLLKEHKDLIRIIIPVNPVIRRNDEWNDPVYDNYAQIAMEEQK